MCQLTFVNTNNVHLNRLFSLIQPRVNSETINKDGFGLFTEATGIVKTIHAASSLVNGGEVVRNSIIDDRPIILHARAASKGIAVETKNVHPFESKNFILAHNGTLWGLDEKVDYTVKDGDRLSDSMLFLSSLQRLYKGDVIIALQEAMSLYKGKFAFLIYHKDTKQFYAVRGDTADLHIATVTYKNERGEEIIGYVINTMKHSLEKGLSEVSNLWQLQPNTERLVWKVEELPKESIFLCGKTGVEKIGVLKETAQYTSNFREKVTQVYHHMTTGGKTGGNGDSGQQVKPGQPKSSYEEYIEEILGIAKDGGMDLLDVNLVSEIVLGVPLHRLEDGDVEVMATKIFTKLEPLSKVRKFINKNYFTKKIGLDFFIKYKLQFPIGANKGVTASTINRFLGMYMEEKK